MSINQSICQWQRLLRMQMLRTSLRMVTFQIGSMFPSSHTDSGRAQNIQINIQASDGSQARDGPQLEGHNVMSNYGLATAAGRRTERKQSCLPIDSLVLSWQKTSETMAKLRGNTPVPQQTTGGTKCSLQGAGHVRAELSDRTGA